MGPSHVFYNFIVVETFLAADVDAHEFWTVQTQSSVT